MGKLVLYLRDGSTREVHLTKERMTIGRRPDNDISLPYPAVSGEHAAVVTVLSDSFLEDLGSTNGTLVNGKSVTKHFLRDRDRIDVGRENLVYYVEDSALPDPLPAELLQGAVEPSTAGSLSRSHPKSAIDLGRRDDAETNAVTRKSRSVATEFESPKDATEASDATAPFRSVISNPDAVDLSGADAPSTAQSVDTESDGEPGLAVRVLTGPSAGRELPLTKDEFILGRVGVAVAIIRRDGDALRLINVEGAKVPLRNGAPVPPEGVLISAGDNLEVAGTELTLVRR